jgi:serine/threonine-protein kinase
MVTLTLLHPETLQPLQKWNFTDRSLVRIGRLPDNDVILEDFLQVSRNHLELRQMSDRQWRLYSQGVNGTFVNGVLVSEIGLQDNYLIQLAKDGPLLKFELNKTIATLPPTATSSVKPVTEQCNHAGNPPTNLFCIRCGQPLVDKEHFVRNYQVLRTLGRGGMGTTYLAWDKTNPHSRPPLLLVLKEMNADMAQIAKARELFEREARVLKSLQHPGIPKYYDFFVENTRKYLAMELIHGQNLEQLIYQKGPLNITKAIEWSIQVCDILTYLHSLESPLVHRDVKPANLMIRNLDNRLILLDFGAVKEIGTPLGTRIGAEGYSAPEQSRGKPCPQSDIYGLGATIIFLLTGKPPMEYSSFQENGYNFDVAKIPAVTPDLGKVIQKACEPNLRDRYADAGELALALTDCLD